MVAHFQNVELFNFGKNKMKLYFKFHVQFKTIFFSSIIFKVAYIIDQSAWLSFLKFLLSVSLS